MKDREPKSKNGYPYDLKKRLKLIESLAALNFGAEVVLADFARNPLFGELNKPLT